MRFDGQPGDSRGRGGQVPHPESGRNLPPRPTDVHIPSLVFENARHAIRMRHGDSSNDGRALAHQESPRRGVVTADRPLVVPAQSRQDMRTRRCSGQRTNPSDDGVPFEPCSVLDRQDDDVAMEEGTPDGDWQPDRRADGDESQRPQSSSRLVADEDVPGPRNDDVNHADSNRRGPVRGGCNPGDTSSNGQGRRLVRLARASREPHPSRSRLVISWRAVAAIYAACGDVEPMTFSRLEKPVGDQSAIHSALTVQEAGPPPSHSRGRGDCRKFDKMAAKCFDF